MRRAEPQGCDVVVSDQVADFYRSCPPLIAERVAAVIDMLQIQGQDLNDSDLVKLIKKSAHEDMSELRIDIPSPSGDTAQSARIRILFAFDPLGRPVLLIAGDKTGQWGRWYVHNVPQADDIFTTHLAGMAQRKGAPRPSPVKARSAHHHQRPTPPKPKAVRDLPGGLPQHWPAFKTAQSRLVT